MQTAWARRTTFPIRALPFPLLATALRARLDPLYCDERRAPVPYLPGLRVPAPDSAWTRFWVRHPLGEPLTGAEIRTADEWVPAIESDRGVAFTLPTVMANFPNTEIVTRPVVDVEPGAVLVAWGSADLIGAAHAAGRPAAAGVTVAAPNLPTTMPAASFASRAASSGSDANGAGVSSRRSKGSCAQVTSRRRTATRTTRCSSTAR